MGSNIENWPLISPPIDQNGRDDQMSGRGNRQKFGDALNERKNDKLDERHLETSIVRQCGLKINVRGEKAIPISCRITLWVSYGVLAK